MTMGYRKERIVTFLHPWADPTGSGFQIVQSLLSFGHGGVFGAGLGEGRQKLFFLPEAHTDFIYAVIGEELGLWGSGLVVLLFVLFLWRCLKLIKLHTGSLEGYIAMGIGTLIGFQSMINLGVVTGLLPTKGIPLPFMSFGGTSLVVNLVMVGILLRISRIPAGAGGERGRRLPAWRCAS
jgi:cell division protein FtsW